MLKQSLFTIILLFFVVTFFGENIPEHPTLFQSNELLELTMVMDTGTLLKDIKEKRAYHRGQLIYRDHRGREIILNIQLRTRGKTRRNPRLCDSPPLAVKFDGEEIKDTIFRDQKKLKLVTHCRRRRGVFEQYLLKEYLVYRLYNQLTEKSFKVRLTRITYVDSVKKNKKVTRFAFFIEDKKRMAQRNNGKVDETEFKYWRLKNKEDQMLLSVFQFLVGNTDWSIPGRHNVKIIKVGKEEALYAVPYDFDMSGFVNAHYARPHKKIQHKIKKVSTRLYRGFCREQVEFDPVIARFRAQKAALYAVCNDFPHLAPKPKKSITRYLDAFFDIIENPRKVKKYLVDNCKKIR